MRFSTVVGLFGLAGLASAFPLLSPRQTNSTSIGNSTLPGNSTSSGNSTSTGNSTSSSTPASVGANTLNTTGVTDVGVLQFALFLEELEVAFYKAGVDPFDDSAYTAAGKQAFVRERFTEIIAQENLHVQTIKQTITQLGGTPNAACTYNFGITDVNGFLMMAQMINDVGPGAYTGSAALISDKSVLTVAAQILAVEARHNAWVRADVNMGDAFPQAFQIALTPKEAFTVASQFVVSCPSNNTALTVTAAPALNVTPPSTGMFSVGETITLKQGVPFGPAYGVGNATYTPQTAPPAQAFNQTGLYAAFLGGNADTGNYTFVPLPSSGQVSIPQGISGQSYVVVTSSSSQVTDASTVAGPAIISVPVPAMTFNTQSTTVTKE